MSGCAVSDSQVVEIAGRNLLVSVLLAAGIEVARPERDRGIDLVAYKDLEPPFTAIPIQMKASRGQGLSLLRKYERFDRLLTVFVWNVLDPHKVEFFGLSHMNVQELADVQGWSRTPSWRGPEDAQQRYLRGGYHVTKAGHDLAERLRERYLLNDVERWRQKFAEVAQG